MKDRRGLGSDPKLHLQAWYDEPGQDVMVVEHGLMCYKWIDDHTILTGPAWVHPAHRRQGIMTKIVKAIASQPGVKTLRSVTHPRLDSVTEMYLKMGRNRPAVGQDGMFHWEDDVEKLREAW